MFYLWIIVQFLLGKEYLSVILTPSKVNTNTVYDFQIKTVFYSHQTGENCVRESPSEAPPASANTCRTSASAWSWWLCPPLRLLQQWTWLQTGPRSYWHRELGNARSHVTGKRAHKWVREKCLDSMSFRLRHTFLQCYFYFPHQT